MSFFQLLCPKNPLMETIRKTYNMTPLNIPDSATQPLQVVAHRGKESILMGSLKELMENPDDLDLTPEMAVVANVSVENTGSLNMDFGFQLLKGLLEGFGVKIKPFEFALKGAKEISIAFESVQHKSIPILRIGKALKGKTLDLENPAMNIFTRPKQKFSMYLISSVLESNSILINVEKTTDDGMKVEAPDLGGLTDMSVELKESSSKKQRIEFRDKKHLTFAFSAIELFFDNEGKIKFGETRILKRSLDGTVQEEEPQPEELSFIEEDAPALMGWNEA